MQTRIIWHGDYTNRSFKEICNQIGIDFYCNSNKLVLPDMESCKRYVFKGLGIAFIAEMYLRHELQKGEIIALPGFKMNRPIYLISRNEKYALPVVTAFKKELMKYCKSSF